MIKINYPDFSGSDREVLTSIIDFLTKSFKVYTGISDDKNIWIIKSHTGTPFCADSGDYDLIGLNFSASQWNQLAYQYAHELTHHLIGGPMSGNNRGQKWFEETLCETASLFGLLLLSKWPEWDRLHLGNAALECRLYFEICYSTNRHLADELNAPGTLQKWMPLLTRDKYARDHYNAIACRLLPLFCTNPCLWRIIHHIGDSESWQSLESLLSHLQSEATEDYQSSVRSMRLLLGS